MALRLKPFTQQMAPLMVRPEAPFMLRPEAPFMLGSEAPLMQGPEAPLMQGCRGRYDRLIGQVSSAVYSPVG